MKLLYKYLYVIIILSSCNPDSKKGEYNVPISKIDYFSLELKGVDEIPTSKLSPMKYIALENTEGAFFGRIDKIRIANNKILILDYRTKTVLTYDISGKYIGKLSKEGKAGDEYLQITDFDVDTNGNIYILDSQADKLNKYDSLFNVISTERLPFEADILKIVDENIIFGLSSWNNGEKSGDKIALSDNKLNITNSLLPYNEYIDQSYVISSYRFTNSGDYIVYNQPIDNNIYIIDSGLSLKKIINIDFANRNVPNKDKLDIESNLSKYNNYCLIRNFVAVKDSLIIGNLRNQGKGTYFLIDMENNIRYESNKVELYDNHMFTEYDYPYIISYFMNTNSDSSNVNLPSDIIEHINNDGCVIGIQTVL